MAIAKDTLADRLTNLASLQSPKSKQREKSQETLHNLRMKGCLFASQGKERDTLSIASCVHTEKDKLISSPLMPPV
eukprot:scaffold85486_cov14-Tisochrysis_lutea.AAC.1